MTADIKTRSPDRSNAVMSVELISRRWLTKKAFEIELTRPPSFEFKAGQNIRFVYGDIQRYYAIVSSPDEPKLVLCVRYIEEGAFTSILAEAGPGTRFDVTGPHGYFIFLPSFRPPVFVATGTGIAPFVCMGRAGIRDFILLHGVSYPEDLYYRNFFSEIARRYVPCLSEPIKPDQKTPEIFEGTVTQYLRSNLPPAEYDFYLCGREEMTRDVTLLIDDNFPGSHVYIEVFF